MSTPPIPGRMSDFWSDKVTLTDVLVLHLDQVTVLQAVLHKLGVCCLVLGKEVIWDAQ
jgi:hypothetical protein